MNRNPFLQANLVALRKRAGLSKGKAATLANVSVKRLRMLERGFVTNVIRDNAAIDNLASLYGVTPGYIIEFTGNVSIEQIDLSQKQERFFYDSSDMWFIRRVKAYMLWKERALVRGTCEYKPIDIKELDGKIDKKNVTEEVIERRITPQEQLQIDKDKVYDLLVLLTGNGPIYTSDFYTICEARLRMGNPKRYRTIVRYLYKENKAIQHSGYRIEANT